MAQWHRGGLLMNEVIQFPSSPAKGLHSLASLPQRGSVEQQAFGVGWWELDEIFKFYPGQFVVVTGTAGHGKSTFILNTIAKLAHDQNVSSFLYVPENEGYLRDKMQKLWPGDEESFQHFAETQCFVQSALTRDDHEDSFHTIEWVLRRACEAVDLCGVELVLIDPWNELDRARPKGDNLTDYIGACLMQVKDFCRSKNVSVVMVAHPTKAVNENGGRVAGLADIEGSMNWFNKCDNGLIVVRDPEKNAARVISAKVRELGAGRIGVCHFHVDPKTGIFTPMQGAVTP